MAHQWHGPPLPQYGVPPYQYQPPQLQTPGQQPFPYNPAAPSPSMRQQYAYPPPANQSRFDANSQIPSPNNIPPQYSSAGFNTALFHQFANSSLPPPPPPSFPPLPLPNGNFSPFISPSQSANNNFQQYSPHGQSTLSNMQHQYRAVEQPTYSTDQRSFPQFGKPQEMDIDDAELGDSQNMATAMATETYGQDSNGISADLTQSRKAGGPASAASDRTDSVSSYNPPSATPPGNGEPASNSHSAVPSVNTKVDVTSKYHGRGAFEMRELAKGALLSLAPHNIKFSDLVAEGIDAQLLSQLFEEVGLKTTLKVAAKAPAANAFLAADPRAAPPVLNQPTHKTNFATDAEPRVDVNEPSAIATSTASAISTAAPQRHDIPNNTALAAAKASDARPSASPIMERKDVIAAMLAAKMGKPVARKESPGAPLTLPAKVIPGPSAVASNISEPPLQPSQPGVAVAPSGAAAEEPTPKATPKPRSTAQTELVRQKLEQLKRESAVKAQAQDASQKLPSPSESRSGSGTASGMSNYPQASLPPKPVLRDMAMGNTQVLPVFPSETNRTVSDSAPPPATNFVSSIPGLFMMDADPDPISFSPSEQGASVRTLAAVNDMTLINPTPLSEALQGTQQQQQPATLDLNALSREPSISRISFKRPLAVDAFEEQDLPPAKQQNSRPSSSREEDLTLNDGFSDDVSEGEIMEIDEGSPVSPLPKTPGSRFFALPSDVIAWPTGNIFTPRNVYQQGSANGLGSTEITYRADLSGRRTAAPSKHDLELEAMKKKLAEAEERRKAKQHASQLRSPISSLSNAPLMPTSSSPVSDVSAMPVPGLRQQELQQSNATIQGNAQPLSNVYESQSPIPSAPVDSFQRAKELREKLLRKKMLKQGLPELDKEVQKTQDRQAEAQARLAQLRREAEKREQEAREASKREQEIMEEVKRLEEQLEMGINGQQQFSQEIETLDQEISPQVTPSAEQAAESQPVISERRRISTSAAEEVDRVTTSATPQSGDNSKDMAPNNGTAPDFGGSISDAEDEPTRQDYNSRLVRPSAEAALPTAEEEAAFLQPAMDDEALSDEEGYQEDSDQHRTAGISLGEDSASENSPMEIESDSDGSASMSDSGSEDYQPAEPIISTDKPALNDDEDEEYDPANAPISGGQSPLPGEDQGDQEEYEPSEIVEPLELQIVVQDQTGSPVSNGTTSENEQGHGDDREHGLELTEANTLTTPQELLPSVPDAADTDNAPRAPEPSASRFTPYQSALSNFKSYRFNPQFTQIVPDGYRSLTYSNSIDPAKPICPTEADGGMCNDPNCEEQHFRQMSLADEKILVQMSSASDIADKAQRDNFVAGLKLVIADLRTKQISDFDTVASELAAYRRRFRQEKDPSLAFTADEL